MPSGRPPARNPLRSNSERRSPRGSSPAHRPPHSCIRATKARAQRACLLSRQAGHTGEEGSRQRRWKDLAPRYQAHRHDIMRDRGDERDQQRIDYVRDGCPASVAEQGERVPSVESSKREWSFDAIDDCHNKNHTRRLSYYRRKIKATAPRKRISKRLSVRHAVVDEATFVDPMT